MSTPEELTTAILDAANNLQDMERVHNRIAELVRAYGNARAAAVRLACAQAVARNLRNWPDNPHIAAVLRGVMEDIREAAP